MKLYISIVMIFCTFPLAAYAASNATGDLASASKIINAVNADWIPALKARDAKRLASPYSENAVIVMSSGKVVIGRTAFANLMHRRFSRGLRITNGALHQKGLREVNGLIIEWGTGTTRRLDRHGHVTWTQGTYVTVWHKNTHGVWKIIRNMSF